MKETWKPLPGWEGVYAVSNQGRARRECRGGPTRVGRILRGRKNLKGYVQLELSHGERAGTAMLHRAVLLAFVGPCPPGCESNHRNGVKADNRLANLEWVTRSENQRHAYATGLRRQYRGGRHPRATIDDRTAVEIVRRLEAGEGAKRVSVSMRLPFSTVYDIKRGRNWKHLTKGRL